MTTRHTIHFAGISSISAICLLSALTGGCENADPTPDVSWNGVQQQAATPDPTPTATPTDTTGTPTTDTTGSGTGGVPGIDPYADQAPYGSFNWSYGGFNGSGASHSGVNISGLKLSSGGLTFHYVNNLSAWGLSNSDAGALACFFVQKSTGEWVGGKFDWISSSRTGRELKHCLTGYNGWTMAGVPNPCQAAFVIVSADGRRRSNVLAGTWSR